MILRKKAFVLWIAAAVLLLAVAVGLFFLLTDEMLTMEDLSVLAEENALPSEAYYNPPPEKEPTGGGRPDVVYLKQLPKGLLTEVEISLDPEEEEIAFAFHPEEGKLILLYSQEDDALWNNPPQTEKGLPVLLELKVDYKNHSELAEQTSLKGTVTDFRIISWADYYYTKAPMEEYLSKELNPSNYIQSQPCYGTYSKDGFSIANMGYNPVGFREIFKRFGIEFENT